MRLLIWLIPLLIISGCDDFKTINTKEGWVETEGTIIVDLKRDDGIYLYHLEYTINTKVDDQIVTGTIETPKRKSNISPVNNQKVAVLYKKKDPQKYDIIDNIKFKKN